MKPPRLSSPERYVGLYVVDFGDQSGVGFTAEEVAELLESEKYKACKVYKIHRAYPDGKLELKGVPGETFQLEAGMLFYAHDEKTARRDFKRLVDLGTRAPLPCRAKVHLARCGDDKFVVALVYPAEYDDDVSSWLLAGDFRTAGWAEGGTGAVQAYYDRQPDVLDRYQMLGGSAWTSRTGADLLASVKCGVQR